MKDARKLLLGVAVVIALVLLYRHATKKFRDSLQPSKVAREAFVAGTQDRWRNFLVVRRPTLVQMSRTDQICKKWLCSYADGIALPRLDLKTVLQDPAHSQVLDGPPGPYRALLARTCSHAKNVEFCSKTLAPGFRFAACMLNWELQLWTNGFGAEEGSDASPPDFSDATGGYGFTAFAAHPDAVAACSAGPAFIVPLPESPAPKS